MSQADSSDSDSNTSSSWVFLDDCTSSNEPEKNKYYLNCSSEPIQELTPQCLNSINLEQETDSDGISIISECDDANEYILNEERPLIEDIEHVPVQNVITQIEPTKIENYINKYVVIGWIVIAVMTPLLLNYICTYMVVLDFEDNTAVDFLKPDLLEHNERNTELDDDRIYDENDMQVADLMAQIYDYNKNTLEYQKKRIDSKGERDIHRINCHEHQCNQLDINKSKAKERHKKYTRKNKKYIEYVKDENKKRDSIKEVSIEIAGELRGAELLGVIDQYEKFSDRDYFKKQENEMIIKENGNKKNEKKHKKRKELNSKLDDSLKIKDKHEKSVHQAKNKSKNNQEKKEKTKDNLRRDIFYQKEIKKLRKTLEQKDKEIKQLTKTLKVKDKHLKILEYKILKELNTLRKSEKKVNQIPKEVRNYSLEKEINSTSGEWYYKLHKGRSKFRSREHAADWVFDRANFRNKRQNMRSNWYWNWMNYREQLRLKKGFWQFTY